MTNVLRSSHQNLQGGSDGLERGDALVGNVPLGFWVFPHGCADEIHLLPALPPFMRIPLLGAHVDDLELVTPTSNVSLLVPHRVSFDCPLSCTLPVHHAASDISPEYYDDFFTASEPGRSPPMVYQSCIVLARCWPVSGGLWRGLTTVVEDNDGQYEHEQDQQSDFHLPAHAGHDSSDPPE